MTTPEQVAAAAFWVDQATSASTAIRQPAVAANTTIWAAFGAWYAGARAAALAAESADISAEAQHRAIAVFAEYLAQVTETLRPGSAPDIRRLPAPVIRNGADPVEVHTRPAVAFRETYAFTGDYDRALERSMQRAEQQIENDIMLAVRDSMDEMLDELQWTAYRRVLRPELSQSGPCGLCVVAADQIYSVGELMPLHGRCCCTVMPVEEGDQAARSLNRADLDRIYAAAGSSSARDLKTVRVQVNEHGELGPVLSVRGENFRGPDDLEAPRSDPAQQLKQLLGVLDELMDPSRRGDVPDGAIEYQNSRIATVRRAAA